VEGSRRRRREREHGRRRERCTKEGGERERCTEKEGEGGKGAHGDSTEFPGKNHGMQPSFLSNVSGYADLYVVDPTIFEGMKETHNVPKMVLQK
jgi:hypothetical protein